MTLAVAEPIVVAGRYELGSLLGTGGMAQVFRARDRVLEREVAVKLFGASVDAHGPERVRIEMRTLARLSHPALVTVHDAGTHTPSDGGPERAFLVMELIDGPTLAQLIASGPLAPEAVAATGAGTAAALDHVHARGVLHRDVKPANILLDATGRPHLADFGIAQTLGQQAMTGTGLMMGTAPYLSPEQVRGQPVTPATDIYSLGLVLLEALTGRREYPGVTAESAVARLSRPPVVDADLPAGWRDLLTGMTASDPAERPVAGEVAERLRELGAEGGATVPLGPFPGGAPTAATAIPTRVLTRAAPVAELAASTALGAVSRPGWRTLVDRARGSRLALVGGSVALLLLVAAVAGAGSSGTARTPAPAVSPSPQPAASAPVPATSLPAPPPARSRAPGPPGKDHGRGKGK